jgi:creatinine amidohydrolase
MRYEEMRPDQLEAIKREKPIAHLPWGAHEWHGPHNALGLDSIKRHHQARRLCGRPRGTQ